MEPKSVTINEEMSVHFLTEGVPNSVKWPIFVLKVAYYAQIHSLTVK